MHRDAVAVIGLAALLAGFAAGGAWTYYFGAREIQQVTQTEKVRVAQPVKIRFARAICIAWYEDDVPQLTCTSDDHPPLTIEGPRSLGGPTVTTVR
jgi:hypothetical protein